MAIGLIAGSFIAGVLAGHFAWERVFGYESEYECYFEEIRRANWGGNANEDAQDGVKNEITAYCANLFDED